MTDPVPDLPKFAFDEVFVITYGRSGSTLMQGILNSIDGFHIKGENNGFVFKLFESYQLLADAKKEHGSTNRPPTKPWYGLQTIDLDLIVDDLRKTVAHMLISKTVHNADTACIGFKEIRHPEMGDQFGAYLDFLTLLFPKAGFVMLSRDLADVAKSRWWGKKNKAWVMKTLSDYEVRAREYASGKDNCFSVTYADMVGQTDNFKAMFEFLGAPYNQDVIDKTLAIPHSY
ncbi:MAG: sulfotransferase [Paracoccaceae bacterium]|nr:sulfotransferase [Paracoccaceae bacterium]